MSEQTKKRIVSAKDISVYAIGQAKLFQGNETMPDEIKNMPTDLLANVIAYAIDASLNDNVFGLYIAERKIKKL